MTEHSLFLAALDIEDPAKRTDFLNESCAGNEALLRHVESLLAAHDRSGEFLDVPALEQAAQPNDHQHTLSATSAESSEEGDANGLAFLQPPLRSGSLGRIGHYEVLEVLGRGGFGIVFRAFDDVLQRVVAVKVLAPGIAATSPARKRFLREARAAAQLRHENVVQIYATEELPLPYLVMEFIPGETLQQRLDRHGPLEVAEILGIGRQIAEGLAAAHQTGMIHRDVKPANVLIEAGPQERVKLTDFGLARAADDASVTQSGVVAGTPKYMAPEQACGAHIDPRADLFSLGSVLYTMCSGRPPFRANNTLAVLKRVVEDTPRPIREIIPEVPQWLCELIAKLHAKDPDERFQTAREVADQLANFEQQLKKPDGQEVIPLTPVAKPSARWDARTRGAVVVVAGVILMGLGVYVLTRPGQQPETAASGKTASEPVVLSTQPTPVNPTERKPNAPQLAVVPFDPGKAKDHQDEWAKYLGMEVEFTNKVGIEMRIIPPGDFQMGSKESDVQPSIDNARANKPPGFSFLVRSLQSESPQHPVRITRPFAIGKTEVTVGQFRQFVKDKEYKPTGELEAGLDQPDLVPVWNLSWEDANEFCKWLSKVEGKTYRLPTEAEWEYACRAGTSSRSFWDGDKPRDGLPYAWGGGKTGHQPQPVGQLKPNAFGLHDICGNVWEWCRDWYGETYYKDSPPIDPIGPEEPQDGKLTRHHVQRGGGVDGGHFGTNSTARAAVQQKMVGFRVVCEVGAK